MDTDGTSRRKSYLSSLKSLDTEERIDVAFYRPIGYTWARLAMRVGMTPNAITVCAIFIGVAAAVFFYPGSVAVNLIGMVLLMLANSLDSADGQLARMTGNYSRLGRILDGLCGDLWFAAIYVAICLRENAAGGWFAHHPAMIWILAVAAGLCHSRQAALADYYRQFHLYFLKGDAGSELDSADELQSRLQRDGGTGWWRRITMKLYIIYTSRQEGFTPAMQHLRAVIAATWPGTALPPAVARKARALSLPLMKFTNILTFNWRIIILFITLLAGCPWVYFVAELTVFNVIMLYMRHRHEAMCRELASSIDS